MTYGVVHGRVLSRPGDPSNLELLLQTTVSTSTDAPIFFTDYIDRWRNLVLVYKNIEKPSNNGFSFLGAVSTNGATFETAAAYNQSQLIMTATTALTATGLLAATAWFMAPYTASPFALATATGKGGAEMTIYFDEIGATTRPQIYWQVNYTNSASSPAYSQGAGNFASGPLRGFSLYNTVQTFSCNVELYGRGRKIG